MYSNSNFSDDIQNVDPNNSIFKQTKQVRESIKSTKEDFDNFLRRTDNKNKIQNFDETFKKDDIIQIQKSKILQKRNLFCHKNFRKI